MNDLNKFLELWEKTGNVEDILTQNLVLPAPEEVQVFLSTLPPARQEKIRISLNDALTALASHTSGMESEASALKEQIDQNIQSSNACLVYSKTTRDT